jgi:hypothetical protein
VIDDGERSNRINVLLSHVLLAALSVLEKEKLLRKDSTIPNISLTLALFFRWFSGMERMEYERDDQIVGMIFRLLKKHDVEITGLHKMDFMKKFDDVESLSKANENKVDSNSFSKDKFGYTKRVSWPFALIRSYQEAYLIYR